ncbi:MAG: DUF2058 domain-containing protein [Planctomycetes bacterium]|nr:DUF2058 domain-containing protein [Planctomycetota bacterium]
MAAVNLRDQFKKANLISDKDARRLAHEARVERTEKGRQALEQEAAARQQELETIAARERDRGRAEAERAERERKQHEELAAVRQLLAEARPPAQGQVRFYFEAPDGSLPWLELSPREAQEVRAGGLCIVRRGPPATHTYGLLPLDATKRVARLLPDVVVRAPRGIVPD